MQSHGTDQKKEKKKVNLLEILASTTTGDPKGMQLFDLIDTDGDGKLSHKELLVGLAKQACRRVPLHPTAC